MPSMSPSGLGSSAPSASRVDPAGVRDQREQQVADLHAPAEGEQAVARIELDDDFGCLLANERLERPRRGLDLRRVTREDLVPGLGFHGAISSRDGK
jgi:hypothetical protein